MNKNYNAPFRRNLIASAMLVAMSGTAHAQMIDSGPTGVELTGDKSTPGTAALIDIKLNAGGLGTISSSAGTNSTYTTQGKRI